MTPARSRPLAAARTGPRQTRLRPERLAPCWQAPASCAGSAGAHPSSIAWLRRFVPESKARCPGYGAPPASRSGGWRPAGSMAELHRVAPARARAGRGSSAPGQNRGRLPVPGGSGRVRGLCDRERGAPCHGWCGTLGPLVAMPGHAPNASAASPCRPSDSRASPRLLWTPGSFKPARAPRGSNPRRDRGGLSRDRLPRELRERRQRVGAVPRQR